MGSDGKSRKRRSSPALSSQDERSKKHRKREDRERKSRRDDEKKERKKKGEKSHKRSRSRDGKEKKSKGKHKHNRKNLDSISWTQKLCRQTHVDEEIYNQLAQKAIENSYDVKKLHKAPQANHPPEVGKSHNDAKDIW